MSLQGVVSATVGIPMEEFVRLYAQEGPFEFIDGERIPILPGVAEHSELIKVLYELLLAYEQALQNMIAYSETPYVLLYTPDWVKGARVPDVMAYQAERMRTYKAQTSDWKKKPFVLVPDLCIEVISPNDIYAEVDEKVERYLSDGVQLILVVNPRTNTIRVHRSDSTQSARLEISDTFDGGDVLPGFKLALKDVFK